MFHPIRRRNAFKRLQTIKAKRLLQVMPLNELYRHPLFKAKAELLSIDERVSLAYKRAGLVLRTHRNHFFDVAIQTPELMPDLRQD